MFRVAETSVFERKGESASRFQGRRAKPGGPSFGAPRLGDECHPTSIPDAGSGQARGTDLTLGVLALLSNGTAACAFARPSIHRQF